MRLSPQRFRAKFKELLLLMPEVTECTLMAIQSQDLGDLMDHTQAVADRLAEAGRRMSLEEPFEQQYFEVNAAELLWQHPEWLSWRHWRSFSDCIPLAWLPGHLDRVTAIAISPDSRQAVSSSDDGTLQVWDLQAHTCLTALEPEGGYVNDVAITPDGRRAVSCPALSVWDLDQARACVPVAASRPASRGDCRISCLAITPDGRQAVTGSIENITLWVWDLESLACVATLARDDHDGGRGGVLTVALSPNGRLAVAGSEDGALHVWDLQACTRVARLEGHSDEVTAVAISPDGRQAVSGSADGTMRVWDLQQYTCTATLDDRRYGVRALAITPDGRHVVSGDRDATLQVWDLQAQACVTGLFGHTCGVQSVAISPDGRLAVSGDDHGTVHVWDLQVHTGSGSNRPPPVPP